MFGDQGEAFLAAVTRLGGRPTGLRGGSSAELGPTATERCDP